MNALKISVIFVVLFSPVAVQAQGGPGKGRTMERELALGMRLKDPMPRLAIALTADRRSGGPVVVNVYIRNQSKVALDVPYTLFIGVDGDRARSVLTKTLRLEAGQDKLISMPVGRFSQKMLFILDARDTQPAWFRTYRATFELAAERGVLQPAHLPTRYKR